MAAFPSSLQEAAPLCATHGVSGLILAGGRGQRMGGQDKGLVLLDGRPLVEWGIARLSPQVDEIMISANRHLATYATFAQRVIQDRIGGFAGPLAGLHAGLSAATHPWLVTVPCDVPFFPDTLVARLVDALHTAKGEPKLATVCQGGQNHPVFCLCHRSLLPALEAFLLSGQHHVHRWQQAVGGISVDFETAVPVHAFENLNTPQDLNRLSANKPLMPVRTTGCPKD